MSSSKLTLPVSLDTHKKLTTGFLLLFNYFHCGSSLLTRISPDPFLLLPLHLAAASETRLGWRVLPPLRFIRRMVCQTLVLLSSLFFPTPQRALPSAPLRWALGLPDPRTAFLPQYQCQPARLRRLLAVLISAVHLTASLQISYEAVQTLKSFFHSPIFAPMLTPLSRSLRKALA